MSDPAAGEELLPGGLSRGRSTIRHNAQAPRLPAPVKKPPGFDGFAGLPPRPPASLFAAGPPPPPPLDVLPERKAGTTSAIRLNAQAPEFAPRLPPPVKQSALIDGFAGSSPRPPVSIFLAGPPPPPPPPPPPLLVDVVPRHKGGGGSAPPQHGGRGVNKANLLHGSTNLGSAGSSYVKLYNNVNIAPEPLDQGHDGTCNFFAVAKGLQMKVHKTYVDHSKECDIITYPNASMSDYCAMRNIRKCDINHPVKDWNKDVRLQKIEYLAKHRGIEAVSGQWSSPRRIGLEKLVFLGKRIKHTQLADLLNNGNPVMCQMIGGPGFEKLKPNQVWSCKPRYKNGVLAYPFYYHVIVLVHCLGLDDPITFLNSGGKGFGHLGYGLIQLHDVKWLYSFRIRYPLRFISVPGPSSGQTWRPHNTAASSLQPIDGSYSTAEKWRSDNGAASSSRSKGKEVIEQKPRGSEELSSRSQLLTQDRSGIDAPRWHRNNIPAAALPRQSQMVLRDRRAIDDAPTWFRNNVAAATSRSTGSSRMASLGDADKKIRSMCGSSMTTREVSQSQSQAPPSTPAQPQAPRQPKAAVGCLTDLSPTTLSK